MYRPTCNLDNVEISMVFDDITPSIVQRGINITGDYTLVGCTLSRIAGCRIGCVALTRVDRYYGINTNQHYQAENILINLIIN